MSSKSIGPLSSAHSSLTNLKRVPFNRDQMELLRVISTSIPAVASAINNLIDSVLTKGIQIIGCSPSKEYKIDMSNVNIINYMERELIPALRKMMFEWLLYGFTCIRIAESLKMPGWPEIVVLPHSSVNIYIRWNQFHQRIYQMYELKNGFETEIPCSAFLVMYDPDENGNLNSPLSACLQGILRAERIDQMYLISCWNGANPPMVFTQKDQISPALSRGGLEGVATSSRLLGGIDSGLAASMYDERERILSTKGQDSEIADKDRSKQYSTFLSEQEKIDQTLTTSLAAMPDPMKNRYMAPPGLDLARHTPFMQPQNIQEVIERQLASIHEVLGVPPTFSHRLPDRAGLVDLYDKRSRESVANLQGRCRPLIIDALTLAFFTDLLDVIDLSEDEASETDPLELEHRKSIIRSEKANQINIFKLSLDSSSLLGDPDDKKKKSSDDEADSVILPMFSVPKENKHLKFKTTFIDVTFNYSPIMTIEYLVKLNDLNLLEPKAFQDTALSLAGVPSSMKRKDYVEFVKSAEKRQEEAETAAITAKRSSPTSSSSSSNSKSKKGPAKKKERLN